MRRIADYFATHNPESLPPELWLSELGRSLRNRWSDFVGSLRTQISAVFAVGLPADDACASAELGAGQDGDDELAKRSAVRDRARRLRDDAPGYMTRNDLGSLEVGAFRDSCLACSATTELSPIGGVWGNRWLSRIPSGSAACARSRGMCSETGLPSQHTPLLRTCRRHLCSPAPEDVLECHTICSRGTASTL